MKTKTILKILFPEKQKYATMKICDIINDMRTMDNKLLKKWINSNYKDFSIYSDPEYRCELFYAYYFVSKMSINNAIKYLKTIYTENELKRKTVFEDYPGLGLSLLNFYPITQKLYFYADNAKDQVNIMKKFFEMEKYDTNFLKEDRKRKGKYDIIISLEVAEHFLDPFDYVDNLIKLVNNSGILIFSTGFKTMYPGHFPKYINKNGNLINSRTTGRNINRYLKNKGFKLIFKGFNQKPKIFKREK